MALADVEATDIDAFYEHMALRWGRTSLHRSATVVRAWLRYARRKAMHGGLADAILLPRIYRDASQWGRHGRAACAATSGFRCRSGRCRPCGTSRAGSAEIRAWVSLETTNRYAEVDLEMKAQTCAASVPPEHTPNWREQ